MPNNFIVRLVEKNDAASILNIYGPYVLNTAITFEYDVPTIDEYMNRIETAISEFPWLVCLQSNEIVGYAYATKFRYRTAYQWSPESTIYLSPSIQGKGVARILYETLFEILKLQGYFSVFAGVAIPNEQSEGLHIGTGFEEIGVFKNIGYKLREWHSTRWYQLKLQKYISEPNVPVNINRCKLTQEFRNIIEEANVRLNKPKVS